MLITSLALLLLNYFSAKTTRELMFRAKYASAQDKIQVVASAFSGVDPLTPESAEQVISVLGNINATRLIVTNAEGTAVYDSSENQNAPIRKQAADLPPVFTLCSAEASSSEESILPSGVSTQSHAPFGMALRMASASRARPWAICVPFGLSGRRYSGSSMSRNSAKPRRRLLYSSAAAV